MVEGEAAVCALDMTVCLKLRECLAKGRVASAERFTKRFALHRTTRLAQGIQDAFLEVWRCFDGRGALIPLDDAEMRRWFRRKFEEGGGERRCGSMLGCELHPPITPAYEEIAIAPRMQITRAAERLAVMATVLAEMVHKDDGERVAALQGAEFAE